MHLRDEMSQPLVSVNIPCFSHERYVRETLDSIAAQSYTSLELNIIDDASPDGSAGMIQAWIQDHRERFPIRFRIHTSNRGITRTAQELLDMSSGQYCCLLASDDRCLPSRFADQVAFFESQPPDVGAIYANYEAIDEYGDKIAEFRYPKRFPQGWVLEELLEQNFIAAPTAMYRTSALKSIGGYNLRVSFEDYPCNLRLAEEYQIRHLPKTVVQYRISSESLSNTPEKNRRLELELARKVLPRYADRFRWVRKRVGLVFLNAFCQSSCAISLREAVAGVLRVGNWRHWLRLCVIGVLLVGSRKNRLRWS